jgi:hypothetical protein
MVQVILNTSVLKDMVENGSLGVLVKPQKNSHSGETNMFFSPSIGLELFNPQVTFVDLKTVVFTFSKVKDINLLIMLRYINKTLLSFLNPGEDQKVYDIFHETDTTFSLRCYIPSFRGKYSVKYFEDNEEKRFKVPKLNSFIPFVLIDIKNIWCSNNRYGFNLVLSEIKL